MRGLPGKYKLAAQIGFTVLLLIGLVGSGFWAGWSWSGANGRADVAAAEKLHSDTLGEIARAGAQQLRQQQELYVAQQARLQALDTKHYQELEDAKAENESLRRSYSDADNERRRLRIEVKVARADARVAGALADSGACSMGDVATLELSGAAGQAVWDIRAGMIEDREKLVYLQGYARECRK